MAEDLEALQQKMRESQAKIHALIKEGSYRTDQGVVFAMPGFEDGNVFQTYSEALQDAGKYFDVARPLRQITTSDE